MGLCWQAFDTKYLYTFKPGGESAFGSSPPASPRDLRRDVCFDSIPELSL